MPTLQQVREQASQQVKTRFQGVVNYFGVPLEPWNHPKSIANYILNVVKHTHSFGCQIVGPMGFGKSTLATVIAHHIHSVDNRFLTIWAEANDFQHLKRFLLSLPKQPMTIIFDDITGALKQMGEREIQKNFEDLTKIRWIIDAEHGKIPTVVFANYHYSKNLEKEFRAVLGMTMFVSFGAEEHTNIDTILPKKTRGRQNLEYFSKISDTMFTQNEFKLLHSNGQVINYKTDDPCRAACAVMGKESRIILTSENDVCVKCVQTKMKKYADPVKIIEAVSKAYKSYGVRALKMALFKRGYTEVFTPQFKTACDFVENKILTTFDIRFDKLVEALTISEKDHKSRGYRKLKLENDGMEEIEVTAEKVKIDGKPTSQEDQIKRPITEDKE